MKKKDKNNDKNSVKIYNILLILAIIIFIILIGRLLNLSTSKEIDGINLQAFAKTRTTREIPLRAKRGNIYDSNGNIIAQDVSSYTLIAYLDPKRTTNEKNPKHVVDKENTALVLSAILKMDYDEVLKYLSKEGVYQTEFGNKGRGLNEITKDTIVAANLPGIDFIETKKRYYSFGDFASYLIGYAKEQEDNNGKVKGELGIEKKFNEELEGVDGYTIYQKDRNGYKIAGTKEITKSAENGKDIYLTIDNNIQFFVEKALGRRTDYDGESMTIVVAEAKTGRILAYATNPSFDPNKRNISSYLDPVVSIPFEPGSTMKIYTYMAALESGVYKGKDTYKSGTFTTKDKTVIKDWNNIGWGTITYDKGFIYSSNTAVVNLMDKYMDADTLRTYLEKFGFGKKTGIDVSNESSGKINFKYETEIFNAAFGQGITTTPIQHIQALTSIANDGELLKPYVVEKIVDENGNITYSNERTVIDTVVSPDTVAYIKNLMWHTINDTDGAAHTYAIDGFDIIGKTGTAQIAKTNGSGYLKGEKNHNRSIAIMFPKENPEIILYGVSTYAAESKGLSSIVKEIITNIAKYRNIYTEEEKITTDEILIDNYLNRDVASIKKELENFGIKVVILGDGDKIINQSLPKGTKLIKDDLIILLTNASEYHVPNLIGYSNNEIDILSKLLKITINQEGNGYVITQTIPPGTLISDNTVIDVKLEKRFKT